MVFLSDNFKSHDSLQTEILSTIFSVDQALATYQDCKINRGMWCSSFVFFLLVV